MTDYRKFFDKEYLGHWDLPDDRDAVVTIEKVEAGELHKPGAKKGERKPLLTFRGTEKKMVVNATNAKTIANLYGTHVEEWVGKRISLFRSKTHGPGGAEMDCIRVRPTVPQPKQKDSEPKPSSEEQPS